MFAITFLIFATLYLIVAMGNLALPDPEREDIYWAIFFFSTSLLLFYGAHLCA